MGITIQHSKYRCFDWINYRKFQIFKFVVTWEIWYAYIWYIIWIVNIDEWRCKCFCCSMCKMFNILLFAIHLCEHFPQPIQFLFSSTHILCYSERKQIEQNEFEMLPALFNHINKIHGEKHDHWTQIHES